MYPLNSLHVYSNVEKLKTEVILKLKMWKIIWSYICACHIHRKITCLTKHNIKITYSIYSGTWIDWKSLGPSFVFGIDRSSAYTG
jgi:hypothetical protein